MTPEDRITKLESMFQKFRISGSEGVSVSGNLEHGYAINAKAEVSNSGASSAPAPILGCTDPLANNFNPSATEDDGSCTYDVTGACCFDNSTCVEESEAACATAEGTYQGDDTVCDPNPCDQCPSDDVILTVSVTGVNSCCFDIGGGLFQKYDYSTGNVVFTCNPAGGGLWLSDPFTLDLLTFNTSDCSGDPTNTNPITTFVLQVACTNPGVSVTDNLGGQFYDGFNSLAMFNGIVISNGFTCDTGLDFGGTAVITW